MVPFRFLATPFCSAFLGGGARDMVTWTAWLVSSHAMYVMYAMSQSHAANAVSHTLHATNVKYVINARNARKSDAV